MSLGLSDCCQFCFVVLQLHVTGTNLTNTCKLLFKLSKTESHDLLFLEEKLCGKLSVSRSVLL